MMNREKILGRKKEALTMSSINCDRCRHLDLAVSKSACRAGVRRSK